MATSKAQLRANKKYQEEKLEEIKFRVPKGRKAEIQDHAKQQGESTNAFILRAVDETMQRDGVNEEDIAHRTIEP
jgi:predicted HicB family RNase H-like nuclease